MPNTIFQQATNQWAPQRWVPDFLLVWLYSQGVIPAGPGN